MKRRVAALLLAAVLTVAMKPRNKQELDALMRLQTPVDDAHARAAAKRWLMRNLADPASAEITYYPAVRVLALQIRNGHDDADPRVAMCGTVSALSPRGNRGSAVWVVDFDPDRPGQVLHGALSRADDDAVAGTCQITYRDGYPVHRVDADGRSIPQRAPGP